MSRTYITSDHHFGHANLLRFQDKAGAYFRGDKFRSVEEMDEEMIARWNAVVKPGDKVYHLGDFCMRRKMLWVLNVLKGRIAIVLGNHDPWDLETWKKYPNVDKLLGSRVWPEHGIIATHIPINAAQLAGRFRTNIHGHMHANHMWSISKPHHDTRYINCCVENTNYAPVDFEAIIERSRANQNAGM